MTHRSHFHTFDQSAAPQSIQHRLHAACVARDPEAAYRWIQLSRSVSPCPEQMELCAAISAHQKQDIIAPLLATASPQSLESSIWAALLFNETDTLAMLLPRVASPAILTNALTLGIQEHHFLMSTMLMDHPQTDIFTAIKNWLSTVKPDETHLPNAIGSGMLVRLLLTQMPADQVIQLIDQSPEKIRDLWTTDPRVCAHLERSALVSACPDLRQPSKAPPKM